jgi:hypothetical protein
MLQRFFCYLLRIQAGRQSLVQLAEQPEPVELAGLLVEVDVV